MEQLVEQLKATQRVLMSSADASQVSGSGPAAGGSSGVQGEATSRRETAAWQALFDSLDTE